MGCTGASAGGRHTTWHHQLLPPAAVVDVAVNCPNHSVSLGGSELLPGCGLCAAAAVALIAAAGYTARGL